MITKKSYPYLILAEFDENQRIYDKTNAWWNKFNPPKSFKG